MIGIQVTEEVKTFQADLRELSTIQVVRKNIIHGGCYILDQSQYFELRSEVARKFNLHPNEILVVGSAKLGFSVAPDKRYRAFWDESDIDVVIVSPVLFDEVWKSVFDYSRDGSYGIKKTILRNIYSRVGLDLINYPRLGCFLGIVNGGNFFVKLPVVESTGLTSLQAHYISHGIFLRAIKKFV